MVELSTAQVKGLQALIEPKNWHEGLSYAAIAMIKQASMYVPEHYAQGYWKEAKSYVFMDSSSLPIQFYCVAKDAWERTKPGRYGSGKVG